MAAHGRPLGPLAGTVGNMHRRARDHEKPLTGDQEIMSNVNGLLIFCPLVACSRSRRAGCGPCKARATVGGALGRARRETAEHIAKRWTPSQRRGAGSSCGRLHRVRRGRSTRTLPPGAPLQRGENCRRPRGRRQVGGHSMQLASVAPDTLTTLTRSITRSPPGDRRSLVTVSARPSASQSTDASRARLTKSSTAIARGT